MVPNIHFCNRRFCGSKGEHGQDYIFFRRGAIFGFWSKPPKLRPILWNHGRLKVNPSIPRCFQILAFGWLVFLELAPKPQAPTPQPPPHQPPPTTPLPPSPTAPTQPHELLPQAMAKTLALELLAREVAVVSLDPGVAPRRGGEVARWRGGEWVVGCGSLLLFPIVILFFYLFLFIIFFGGGGVVGGVGGVGGARGLFCCSCSCCFWFLSGGSPMCFGLKRLGLSQDPPKKQKQAVPLNFAENPHMGSPKKPQDEDPRALHTCFGLRGFGV